jgi:hypothetical protein
MWGNSAVRGRGSFARQDVLNGSSSDNDQGDNGGGGVETVGTVDDEPDAAVGSFVAAIADAEPRTPDMVRSFS